MAKVCPRCRGTRMIGRGKNRGPCPACNADAPGDKVVGVVYRLVDRVRGTSVAKDGRTTTVRPSRFGTEVSTTRVKAKQPKRKSPGRGGSRAPTVPCVHGVPLNQSCPDC